MFTKVLFAVSILVFIVLLPLQALTQSKGAPGSNTGARGNDTCAASGCHEGAALNAGPGDISITTQDAYAPGATMNFTVRVEQAGQGRFGFQATVRPVNDPFRFTGEFGLGSGTDFADAIQRYITHDDAASGDGAAEWTFQWTAPMDDVGNIRVYAAGVAANANGQKTGDFVYTDSLTVPTSVSVEDETLPDAFTLQQAYPNPFQSQTTIAYTMEQAAPIQMSLYDAMGRVVKTVEESVQPIGVHEILIDADDLPAGTYFYELRTPTTRKTGSVVRVR